MSFKYSGAGPREPLHHQSLLGSPRSFNSRTRSMNSFNRGNRTKNTATAEQSSETFSNFPKIPNIESHQLVYRSVQGTGDSILIKSPFKQSKPLKTSRSLNGSLKDQRLISAKSNISANYTLKPISNLDQFSQFNIYNPSTNLILKTAHSINDFVDFFEKNRNNTTACQAKIKGTRSSKYAGLKPLNYVQQSGPSINNCLGVVIEPKESENPLQLKEVYEHKLALLAQKRAMQSRSQENNEPSFDNMGAVRHLLESELE